MRWIWAAITVALGLDAALAAPRVFEGRYPEGPVWVDGTAYWAEMYADRIIALRGAEPEAVFSREGCGPTALARLGADRFVVLCHIEGALVITDSGFRTLRIIDTDSTGRHLRNPNDASRATDGSVWFTDPGPFTTTVWPSGRVYRLTPQEVVTLVADDLAYANGILASADGILVSEHLNQRLLRLQDGALAVAADLSPQFREHGTNRLDGPDGLETAPDGVLWVAAYGIGRLYWLDADLSVRGHVSLPFRYVTNIAFAPDGRAVVTGAHDNVRGRAVGEIWVLTPDALAGMIRTE